MKIGFCGIDGLQPGKIKFNDSIVNSLAEKCSPKKTAYYYFEFLENEFRGVAGIAAARDKALDVLIPDIEKFESRLTRAGSETEKKLLARCLRELESEKPLCDAEFSPDEYRILNALEPVSLKPVLVIDEFTDTGGLIEGILEKSKMMFFYTAGPAEVHAWPVRQGSDIVTCAGRIHTDLARGFIRAEIVSFEDFMACHNMNDCRKKGVVRLVDRDYIIRRGDIVDIRFNV